MNKTDLRQMFSMLVLVTNIGLQLAASILVGVLGGQAVDKWLDSYPIATFVGAIFGAMSGMWSIYRRIAKKL